MRKIMTFEEKEKRDKRNRLVIGVILIFLLFSSLIGYAFFNNLGVTQQPNYDGQNWVFERDGRVFYFANSPEVVQQVNMSLQTSLVDLLGKEVFIVSEQDYAINMLGSALQGYSRVQEACLGSCDEDLPEKTCNDNVIVFREGTQRSVYQDNKCVFIEGDLTSLEAFSYRLLEFG